MRHDYDEVARLYLAGGSKPTAHVAQTLGIGRDAAAKAVARAREKGLLPLTQRGRATPTAHRPVLAYVGRSTSRQRSIKVCDECLDVWPCRQVA